MASSCVTAFLDEGAGKPAGSSLDLTSEAYAKNLNEVQEVDSVNSPLRANEQTQIALFWRASRTAIWNGALAQALAANDLDMTHAVRPPAGT